jgi:kinesin family protein 6/9
MNAGTILAYGQTGAGKTFTMTGATQNYKYRGITPRALAQIFREIQDKPETAVVVRVSYLEIYNEALFDLLPAVDGAHEDLQVMDDAKGQVSIKGLNKLVVQSEEEALHALFNGDTNRQIGSHQMNLNSSRSHTIFTVHLEMRSRVDSSEKVISSKLNLVDLAGSERIKKTGSSGLVLKEAQYINKSLSFLEQVVMALSDKNRDHVPFRQSKLTNVLRDSLGGNCKTRLVANVWVEREELEVCVLLFPFSVILFD